MILPESDLNQPMFPWYTEVHDGMQREIDASEMAAIAQKFDAIVSDLHLNHIDKVIHLEGTAISDILSLNLPAGPMEFWSLSVKVNKPLPGNESKQEPVDKISLQRVKDALGHEGADYYKGADGVVRRHTFGDATAQVAITLSDPENIPPGDDVSPQEALVHLSGLARSMANAIQNQRLAKDMGYNDQPVGMQEMDALIDFLSQSGFQTT